ncbi:two-partner secretion domain-containing protein [Desulfotignum phosphitoxidans]|uniref:Heme/hemopexin-binding protein HxuA n=1 Tax=Desulfotignum phosphitoxidans DSM 13687 TaxID=1286635 RepID=S0G6F4_9BACT|nr:filamentous hemagglutinin N-terminal domain-containing protein [Desulfotignum phosphitoxidans]EMS81614.1 heme/hemopexin-binding protein HxuA [Desulfotignum phosphitoxidans DSM 13687]
MNRIYRVICNAVSEKAKSAGKKSASGATVVARVALLAVTALTIPAMMSLGTSNAYALPAGGVVSAGGAAISSGAGTTTINQSTPNAAINWQSFDIGQTESVRFVQPGSNSVALNRVLGADPSSILGTLSANGQVFLLNPNGILFGKDAQVNVGGLVASTLSISDRDFMAGKYQLSGTSNATILNQGSINADGGYVALLGANVSNEGIISARLGTVTLAAGNGVTLDVAGDGLLNVAVDQGSVNALAQNGGLIQADGGQVLLTARSAGNLLQSAVNNTGVIQAQTIENHNGTIMLTGDMQNGTVNVDGTLDASGTGAGQTGGSVTVTGHNVDLPGAQINASGDAGGGTVLIGGDYQGKNPEVQNASATYMSKDSTISADAITNGNGGKVIVWSDDSTRAHGSISARGGAQGGDGGLIETSGHWLEVEGIKVDTSAPNGSYGMWLLDPADITISTAVTSGATKSGAVFSPNSGVSSANVNVADLVTALGSTNVTVTTENTGASGSGVGDIDVNDAITWTAVTTLTLDAFRDVNVNAAITGTDGSLSANSGRDVKVGAAITTTTGNLTFNAVNDVNLAAATTITTGDLTAIAGQNVNVSKAISVTTGDVILRADNDGTGPGAILGGTVDITSADNSITINTGTLSIRFNPADYTTTNAEITAYGLKLTGGGSLDAKAWVFGLGDDKVYDGLRTATVSGLEPDIASNPPPGVALGAVSNALFDTKDVGTEKLITFDSTFNNAVYDLFAPFGTTPGTYHTRADITPKALDITANDQSKIYGELKDLGTTEFTHAGLISGDTVTGVTLDSTGTPVTADVGSYPINASAALGTGLTNYAIAYHTGTLAVGQKALNITANDQSKVYGELKDLGTTEFTHAGLINDDTVTGVTLGSPGTPVTANAGPYAINASAALGTGLTNYAIAYNDGTLTVIPAVIPPAVIPPAVIPPVTPPVTPPVIPPEIRPLVPPVVRPLIPPVTPTTVALPVIPPISVVAVPVIPPVSVVVVPVIPQVEGLNLNVIGTGVLIPVDQLTGAQLAPPPSQVIEQQPSPPPQIIEQPPLPPPPVNVPTPRPPKQDRG